MQPSEWRSKLSNVELLPASTAPRLDCAQWALASWTVCAFGSTFQRSAPNRFKIQVQDSNIRFKIQVQDSNFRWRFKIQVQLDSRIRFKIHTARIRIQIQDSDSRFKYKTQTSGSRFKVKVQTYKQSLLLAQFWSGRETTEHNHPCCTRTCQPKR